MTYRIILFLALAVATSLTADTRRVFLGNIDLAGLVPQTLPTRGDRMVLESTEAPVLDEHHHPTGYLPVLFREPVARMLERGVAITLEVEYIYQTPRPGRFVRTTIWADTQDLSLIEPLIYHIPIHTEDDLSDYE